MLVAVYEVIPIIQDRYIVVKHWGEVLLPAKGEVFRSPALVGADGALRRYRGWCLLGTFWRLLGDFGFLGYSRMCFQPRDLSVGCYLLFTAKF